MVLYGITLFPFSNELQASYPGLLSPFYIDDAAFGGSARRSAHLLKLFIERGADRGYLPNPSKLLFIANTLGQEEAVKREFYRRAPYTFRVRWLIYGCRFGGRYSNLGYVSVFT